MSNFGRVNIADEIKSRCNIVDVVGRVVPLKRAGANYKGICPFHNEKTPSFVVSEQKQIFTCFGCGATGDVIEFVKRYNNLDFVGAAEALAKEYGIDISGSFTSSSKDKEELYEINRQAARYWYKKLREKANPGYAYMQKRGISNDILNKFGIGFAEDSWQDLYDHLTGMGFGEEKLYALGLISRSQKTGKYYDKFRNRVIFPIINTSGKVIGFSGRIIGDGEPKYLNSQESGIFLKKNNLYGLNLAVKEIKNDDRIILVEGQMDVVSLYQSGIRNVSASLGTALTENQARLIKRYTKNVVLSYDADKAGQKAADRGIDILYSEGLIAKVMQVSDGKDPDEFVKTHGRREFMELADKAESYGDFKIRMIAARYDLDDPQQRVQFIDECAEALRRMKPVEADIYIKRLAEEYGISENAVRAEYTLGTEHQTPRYSRVSGGSVNTMTETESDLLKLATLDAKYVDALQNSGEQVFTSNEAQEIFEAIVKCDTGHRPMDTGKIEDLLETDVSSVFERVLEKAIPEGSEDRMFGDCISSIRKKRLEAEEQLLITSLKLAEEEENEKGIIEFTKKLMDIQKEIKNL